MDSKNPMDNKEFNQEDQLEYEPTILNLRSIFFFLGKILGVSYLLTLTTFR